MPDALTTTRSVPWQPASMYPPDGSPRMATSACSQSGSSRSMRPRPLAAASISSQSYITSVMSCVRFGDRRGQVQEDRVTRLHVRRAAAVQFIVGQAAGHVVGGRNGVDVAGEQHPRRPAQVGAGQHGVGIAHDLESGGLIAQGGFDLVGDAALAARFAGDVHQRRGQGDRVAVQIKGHRA